MALQFEDALDDLHLGCCWLQSAECHPIVDHKSSANHIRSSVDGSGAEWDLKQVAEFIELLHSGLRVHQASIIADHAIGSDQQIVSHWVSEHLNA